MQSRKMDVLIPRSYQRELFAYAKERNVILVLGTGSGKTYISVLLIKEYGHEIIGKLSEGAKRTVFIVNTTHLVIQQAEVIRRQTPYKVGSYIGSMGVDYWSDEKWTKELDEHEVIVIVDQILLDLILHSRISLEDINLLIVDECHHATGKHPMREIMREYSRRKELKQIVPKVLGMTACVFQKKVKPGSIPSIMHELECVMNSALVTTYNKLEEKLYVTSPKEFLLPYKSTITLSAYVCNIQQMLNTLIHNVATKFTITECSKPYVKLLNSIMNITTTLGEWGLLHALQLEVEKLNLRLKRDEFSSERVIIEFAINEMSNIINYCQKQASLFTDPLLHISDHVRKLLNFLESKKNIHNICGIIFVQRRNVAKILFALLTRLCEIDQNYGFIKPGYVLGSALNYKLDIHLAALEMKKYKVKLEEFRRGQINFIISTSVLEEGIDVKKCNVVIQFDDLTNYRAYVQSKGRARASLSEFVVMTDENINVRIADEIKYFRHIEDSLNKWCHDRILPSLHNIEAEFSDEVLPRYLPYGDFGPQIAPSSAVRILYSYCNKLKQDRFASFIPSFTLESDNGRYRIGIKLPIVSKVRDTVWGDYLESHSLAKVSAALKTCQKLHEARELNEWLVPFSHSDEKNSLYIENSELECPTSEHVYRKEISSVLCEDIISANLYVLNIIHQLQPNGDIPDMDSSKCKYKLGLICSSSSLLQHNCFPLFSQKWGSVYVVIEKVNKIELTHVERKNVIKFHDFVMRHLALINDHFEFSCGMVFVPLNLDCNIQFDLIKKVSIFREEPFKSDNFVFEDRHYVDAIVIPRYHTEQMFRVSRIAREFLPSSPFPEDKQLFKSFNDYFLYRYHMKINNQCQPLLECKHFPKELNYIQSFASKKLKGKKYPLLIPELCILFPIPASFWWHLMCIPSVIQRLNSLNLARELALEINALKLISCEECDILDFSWSENIVQKVLSEKDNLAIGLCYSRNFCISPSVILQALSSKAMHDGYNLERLELLGDSFLKYSISIFLFNKHRSENEGFLTQQRSHIVSNKTLYKYAVKKNIPYKMQATVFHPRINGILPMYMLSKEFEMTLQKYNIPSSAWHLVPDKKTFEDILKDGAFKGLCYNPRQNQSILNKLIADCVEALIGVYLLIGGYNAAVDFLIWLGLKFLKKDIDICKNELILNDGNNYVVSLYVKHRLFDLENIFGYNFADKTFLVQAVTHPSFNAEHVVDCYQRLEFIGDAVLDFLVSTEIFSCRKPYDPGEMTDMRSYLVKNETLAEVAITFKLEKYLIYFSEDLLRAIERYRTSLESEINEFNYEDDDTELEDVEVPKALGDMVEAIIGAVYIDSNCSLIVTWKLVKLLLQSHIERVKINIPINEVRKLYETHPDTRFTKLEPEDGLSRIEVTVSGLPALIGKGKNKRTAKLAAARLALSMLP